MLGKTINFTTLQPSPECLATLIYPLYYIILLLSVLLNENALLTKG